METLAFLLLVTMQRNNAGMVSVSMELFNYGYLVTTASSQTRHNIINLDAETRLTGLCRPVFVMYLLCTVSEVSLNY
jgi:hypothetical protein